MADRIQQRRDTAARWAQFNPVLLEGEVGYVLDDPNQYKIGDGVHAWNDLPLRGFDGTLVHELGDSQTTAMSQYGVTDKINKLNSNVGIDEYPIFSDETAYKSGDIVNYQGKLYQFTSDHAAGVWIGTDTSKYNLNEDLHSKLSAIRIISHAKGKNLFDMNNLCFGGERYYISPDNGKYVKQPIYPLFVSALIPLNGTSDSLTISKQYGKFDYSQGYLFLNEIGNIIEFGHMTDSTAQQEVVVKTIPNGAKYFQFCATKIEDLIQVEYGNTATAYERALSDYDIAGKSYGVFQNTSPKRNLFDKNRLSFSGFRHYISPENGTTKVDMGNYGLAISHPIDVDTLNETKITIFTNTSISSTLGHRFVDENNNIIAFGAMGNTPLTLDIPKKAKYFQFSYNVNLINLISVVSGEIPLVVPYRTEVENTALDASNNLLAGVYGTKNAYIDHLGKVFYTADYDMFLFNPIPVKPNTLYTLGCLHKTSNLTGGGYFAYYDSDFNAISALQFNSSNKTGDNYWEFTTPDNTAYIRFAVSYYKRDFDYFLYEMDWDSITNYDPTIVNGTMLKIFSFSENAGKGDGKNLYDGSIQDVIQNRYINPTNGNIVEHSPYDIFASDLIEISYSEKYLTLSANENLNESTGWRFLSEGLQILSYGNVGNEKSITIPIPIGAKYFQFSTNRRFTKVQVEYGKEATDFEEYKGVASTYYVNKAVKSNANERREKSYLPSVMYFSKNRSLPLYYDNFINNAVWQKLDIQLRGAGVKSYNGIAAVCNPQSDGELSVNSYQYLEAKELQTVSAKVIDQTNNNGKTVKIMCLGDSFTEISYWVEAIKDNLTEDGVTVNLIGAMHSVRSGQNLNVSTENQTGGTLYNNFMSKVNGKCYVVDVTGVQEKNMPINYANYVTYKDTNNTVWTVWGYDLDESGNGKMRLYNSSNGVTLPTSGTLTKNNGTGDTSVTYANAVEVNKNPFWNMETSAFDAAGITAYFSLWEFDKPDILILQFMWNDFSNWATDSSITQFITRLKTFISTFRSAVSSSLPVIFSIESSAPINMGQENNGSVDNNGRKYTVLKLAEALYTEFAEDVNTYICPAFASVDLMHALGSNEISINKRFADYKVEVSTDAIHPIQQGMYQIGDAVTPYVHNILLNL